MDKLFVIAIGGTGMRCLEAFTHLCGIGMFDNQEIEILTLDTDQNNGNKGRVEEYFEELFLNWFACNSQPWFPFFANRIVHVV